MAGALGSHPVAARLAISLGRDALEDVLNVGPDS